MVAATGPAARHAVTAARPGNPVSAKASPAGFGGVLRFWRTSFGLSQEELAGRAGVSPRHISFLENGRTAAGEGVASGLARALGLPPREAATLMLAAGHVPPLAGASAGLADDATLVLLLRQTDPHPAAVLDALGNIRLVNKAWVMLHRRALGALADAPDLNALRLLLHEQGWRRYLDDWEDIAAMFLTALKQEALIHQDPEAGRLLREMLAMPSVPDDWVRRGLAPSRLGYTVRVGTGAEARTAHIVHMMAGLFPFGGARPPIVQFAYPESGKWLLTGADLHRLPGTRHPLCPY
ncbi:helix-turn-helix domain-containing protein [Sphingopyxis sp. JAI128]|uniref:helix-turn-helix domain-containing protein n=1 Tax=Sphingopyxis sp. JAI128 TaxID=2723066 RepID=UPI0016117751|nr:helix-turn-helix domain-containing protein [Sphingopyxis sp. JAI128]MBB6427007.1 transcriptional regulator with XRE-family HTH domain [Sphingopyxis sp. JAI128]